ncbi:hypothetical protein RhiJN_06444 [Ceratobasidium sp. AG-Ba]|nr:hypothetical protein RhiJN_06444 [Ceratobasidium sp. AG-Ba]
MDPSPESTTTAESASGLPPPPMIRSYVLSTAAGSCFVALLAVAFTVVWHRKQRWRRARPWLAKLRAETASKIEKERERDKLALVEHKEPVQPTPKDTPKGKEKVAAPTAVPESRTDAGKRTKERRKRGKESKPATRNAAPAPAPVTRGVPARSSTPKPEPPVLVERPPSPPSPPLSPHLIPLPQSPTLDTTPTKLVPPALVLSGPTSSVSTSVSISATATELIATTPTTSRSVSPPATSPAFINNSEISTHSSKLPAFPPASPLPPSLARKPPPLARRPTPAAASASMPIPNINRKDSHAADRRKEPSRKGTAHEESDGPVDEIEFPTLSPWPVVGKQQQAEGGKRREGGRKPSDVGRDGRKVSDAGRGRKPSDAKKKAGVTNPESTQLASLRGALEAARIREEEVAEERRAWAKKERELQTQINQLAHQLQLAMMFPGGMQGYPGYGYGYGPMPPTPGQGPMPSAPGLLPQPPPEAVSPEQTSPISTPAPVPVPSDPASVPGTPAQPYPPTYLPFPPPFPMFAPPQPHGSPMPIHGSPMPSPMPVHSQPPMSHPMPMPGLMSPPYGPMSPPQSHPYPWRVGTPNSGMMPMPVPSRRPTGFFGGSPRGSRSRSPFVHPSQRRHGTPSSTPSVGSSADIGGGVDLIGVEIPGLGNSADISGISADMGEDPFKIVHTLPTSLKREREDDDDDASSSEESDYDEDSDDDSVIFEDGSVSDSVNLSLHGENKEQEPDLVSLPVDIRIGDDTS